MIFDYNGYFNLTNIYDNNRTLITSIENNCSIFHTFCFGENIFVSYSDEKIYIWDLRSGLKKFYMDENDVITSMFLISDNVLITGYINGIIKVWDINERKIIINKNLDCGNIFFITIMPNNRYIFIGGENIIVMMDKNNFKIMKTFFTGIKKMFAIYFSPDNEHFATSTWEFEAKVWNINLDKSIQILYDLNQFLDIKFSSKNYIASKHFNDVVKVWKLKNSDYVFSYSENKFHKKFNIDWVIKKSKIDKEYKRQIRKSLDILPTDIINKIIHEIKFKECLTLNGKILFFD